MKVLGFIRKALGALLGGATGVGVSYVLHAFGVDVDAATATTIATVCATLGTVLAPANKLTVKQLATQVARRTDGK